MLPVTEALKCPECSAPLEYPANGGPAVRCEFCGSTVLLPGASGPAANPSNSDFAAGLGSFVGNAMEMAQISDHVRAGSKIEAIRLYRRTFGGDLRAAKTAIDKLAGGLPILLEDHGLASSAGPGSSSKAGCITALAILIGTTLVVLFLLRSGHQQQELTKVAPMPALPAIPSLPPGLGSPLRAAAPDFARVVMQFGSSGIGPGQFLDHRSIAVDGRGHLYVGEYTNGRVQVFDADGKFIKAWSTGSKMSLLTLAASRNGTVYAVVPGHILCFEGATGLAMGEAAKTHDDIEENYIDAFAAQNGDIYAIGQNNEIVILDSDGRLKSFINATAKVGEDVSLNRVIVNGTGEIYALDRRKGIFKFASDGRYLNRFGSTDPDDRKDPANISFAQNVAVDGQGRIYVSGSSPAIRVFDANGRYLDSLGGNDVAFGLAINDRDEIFACFRNQHEVRKFVVNSTVKN